MLECSWVMSSHCNKCAAILFLLLGLSCILTQSHQQTLLPRRRACRVLVAYRSINTFFCADFVDTMPWPFCPMYAHIHPCNMLSISCMTCWGRWCASFALGDHAAASGLIWCQQAILQACNTMLNTLKGSQLSVIRTLCWKYCTQYWRMIIHRKAVLKHVNHSRVMSRWFYDCIISQNDTEQAISAILCTSTTLQEIHGADS